MKIGDFLSLHTGEAIAAVKDGWPFPNGPTGPNLLRLTARLFATRGRAAGTVLTVLLVTLTVLAAHAAA